MACFIVNENNGSASECKQFRNGSERVVKKILLIEDNPADVFLVEQAILSARIPAEFTVLEDGGMAAQWIEQHRTGDIQPDLILLDLNLPIQHGLDVLEYLRSQEHFASTPVAVLTSSNLASERSRALALGVDEYIVKPMDLDQFLSIGFTVQKLLAAKPESRRATV
jgi:CheY-like chemotaxis protein